MSRSAVAVALGAASASAYGLASSLQHREAADVLPANPLAPGLLVSLAKRPGWRLAMVADLSAVALQGAALRFGAVVLVQLLVVGGLPIAVLLSALWRRTALTRRHQVGLLLCTGGLVLAVPASTGLELGRPAAPEVWAVAAVTVASVTLCLVALARATGRSPALLLGVAAGITAGGSSVLLAVCASRIDHPATLLRNPAPYAAIALGLVTLSLTQAAFQTGAIGAPLAALSLVEPAAAVVLAIAVLHQRVPTSPSAVVPAVVGLIAAVIGVLLLSQVSTGNRGAAGEVSGPARREDPRTDR